MLIRPFADDDLENLRDLWRRTWRDSYGLLLGTGADAIIDASLDGHAIQSMFAEDGGCLVAIEEQAVAGSLCFVERGPIAYMWGMYVRPDRQRRGIGTALIRSAVSLFASATSIDLSAVDDRALAFYRKLGFVEQGPGEVDLFPEVRVPTRRLVVAVSHPSLRRLA